MRAQRLDLELQRRCAAFAGSVLTRAVDQQRVRPLGEVDVLEFPLLESLPEPEQLVTVERAQSVDVARIDTAPAAAARADQRERGQ